MLAPPPKHDLRRRGWLWGIVLALATACVSPTLPPDDPPVPDVELGEGTATLSGFVPASPAFVFAHNRSTGLLFGQRTITGAYRFELAASPCDRVALWYQSGDFQSTAIDFVLADAAGVPPRCDNSVAPSAAQASPDHDAGEL